jgi:hypothetical protein
MGLRDLFKPRQQAELDDLLPLPDGKFAPLLRDNSPAPPYVSLATQDLLSIGLAAAVYHGLTRDMPDYDLNIGAGLAHRYIEEPRSRYQFQATASFLALHCHPIATTTFLQMTADAGFDHGLTFSREGVLGGADIGSIMDMYDIGQFCATDANFQIDFAPFAGIARVLFDAGYQGISENHPDVQAARKVYAAVIVQS